jgi:release factor glutamine methyltransferase
MTYAELWGRLTGLYGEGEAKAIARMVFEVRYHLTLADILLGKDTQLSADCQEELEEIAQRLLRNEPVQYVLGEAEFCGRWFHVEPGVLIPRPETEELCRFVLEESEKWRKMSECRILDVGTGSGCIAISLAAEMPHSIVTSWDVSTQALAIAQANARRINVDIRCQQVDVLHLTSLTSHLSPLTSRFDIIVSNPPYICHQERNAMESNVLDHEPALALFVPDDDPLLFYRAIAAMGLTALREDGCLYFEINPLYVDDLKEMLHAMSYRDIMVRNDQYGKQRMMKAIR